MKCPTLVLLISLFFVDPALCFAQDDNEKPNYEYVPLVRNVTWWLRSVSCGDGPPSYYGSTSYHLSFLSGGAFQNDTFYYVLVNTEPISYFPPQYFREEDKIVYQYIPDFGEIMIYDFSKALGDTIYKNNLQGIDTCIVSEVSSVDLCNDNYVKSYSLTPINSMQNCGGGYTERIGRPFGDHLFINRNQQQTCTVDLIMMGRGREVIYGQHCGEDDFIPPFNSILELAAHFDSTYVSNIPVITNKISIYPNPTVDVINIGSDLPVNLIEIYSIEGKRVAEFSNERVLDIGHLAKGIYIVSVELEGGELFKQKVVRQ